MKQYLNTLLTMVVISSLLVGCKGNKDVKTDRSELNKTIPVSAVIAKKSSVTNDRTYAGSLEGIKQSNLVSKIAERVISVKAQVGQYVRAGEVIIELDKTGASSQYLQAKANYENMQKDLERMKALFAEGAVAKQVVDQTETGYLVAKANYESSKSSVELSSPISGTVTAININPGDWVTPGTALAVVADISRMIITFNVSESEVSNIKKGDVIRIYSEFDKDKVREGRISEINRSASLDARSFRVKAEFGNDKENFYKPGMFVKADIVLQKKDNVLTIPTEALINQAQGTILYTIKNGIASPVTVTTGFSNEKLTEITSGVVEGDSVVIQGMNNLSENTKVSIVKR